MTKATLIVFHLRDLALKETKSKQTIDTRANWWLVANAEKCVQAEDLAKDVEIVKRVIEGVIQVDLLLLDDEEQLIIMHPNCADDSRMGRCFDSTCRAPQISDFTRSKTTESGRKRSIPKLTDKPEIMRHSHARASLP
jgi:hypothetical protein